MESVRNQSFVDWEHIVVDDGSTDDSVRRIKAQQACDNRIRLIEHKSNQGPRKARNLASERARGRYIAFLDSDDYWLPDKLEQQLNTMEQQGAPISGVGYEVRDMRDRWLRRRHVPKRIHYTHLLFANLLSASTTIYDTQYFGRVLNHCPWGDEDHHLWLQMLRKPGTVACGLDEVFAVVRQRPGSRSDNKIKALRRRWQTYRRAQSLSLISSCLWFGCYACESITHRTVAWCRRRAC